MLQYTPSEYQTFGLQTENQTDTLHDALTHSSWELLSGWGIRKQRSAYMRVVTYHRRR